MMISLARVCALGAFAVCAVQVTAQTMWVPGGTSTGVGNNTANGNVGFGTSAPAAYVHILGHSSREVARFQGSTDASNQRNFLSIYTTNPNYWWELSNQDPTGAGSLNGLAFRERSASGNSVERMYLAQGGNVGVGTTAPFAKLDVEGRVSVGTGTAQNSFVSADAQLQILTDGGVSTQLAFWQSGVAGALIGHKASDANLYFTNIWDGSALGTAARSITLTSSGNVGIGTTSPTYALSLGSTLGRGVAVFESSGGANVYGLFAAGAGAGGSDPYRTIIYANGLETISATYAGNVGIGTASPSHRLSVNGTIKTKEVIVETTGWADHVFADDYRLAPLDEVEAHIRAKKHLPGIPSAATVAEQGISLGEMQAKLLEKIEELTLHVIRQEREIQKLRTRLETVEPQMTSP